MFIHRNAPLRQPDFGCKVWCKIKYSQWTRSLNTVIPKLLTSVLNERFSYIKRLFDSRQHWFRIWIFIKLDIYYAWSVIWLKFRKLYLTTLEGCSLDFRGPVSKNVHLTPIYVFYRLRTISDRPGRGCHFKALHIRYILTCRLPMW